MPEELLSGGSLPPPAQPSPPSEPAPTPTPESGFQGTPPGEPTPAPVAPTAPQPTQWTSIREAAKQYYGMDLTRYPDDASALQALIAQASQGQQYEQTARRYMQAAPEFERWQTEQAAKQQQQQPQQPGWWNPPEFKKEWAQYVSVDPQSGEYVLAKGADPRIMQQFLAYRNYRSEFANRLTEDPRATLEPLISEVAKQQAETLIQQHMGNYKQQLWANNYIAQNSEWLHARDQQGNVQFAHNPQTGRPEPALSPMGQRFREYCVEAHNQGITDLETMQKVARGLLERDLYAAQIQQLQAGQKGEAAKQALLQQANRQPTVNGSVPPVTNNGPQTTQNGGLSLREQLRANAEAMGITDDAMRTEMSANLR